MSVLSLEESPVQLKHDLLDVFHFSPGYARLRAWSWVKYHLYQQIFPIPLPGNFQVTWRVLTSSPDLPVHEIVDLNFSLRSSTEWAISFVMGTALQVIWELFASRKGKCFPSYPNSRVSRMSSMIIKSHRMHTNFAKYCATFR